MRRALRLSLHTPTRAARRHPERYSAKDPAGVIARLDASEYLSMTDTGRLVRGCLMFAMTLLSLLLIPGCDDNPNDPFDYRMVVQPKYNPMDQSRFFTDGQSARTPVEGTIPINGYANELPIPAVNSIRSNATTFPFPLARKDLEQGRNLFTIYCAVCHGALGDGNGMIPQRGFTHPPSFYLPRLREAQPGHFYDVITNGYGAMYSYNDRISHDDRWRIVGYVRALQLSDPTNTGVNETPPTQRE